MTGHELPAGIGPHEGREFMLMRDGKKNVALFFEVAPDGLDAILSDGFNLLLFRQFEHQGRVFFTRIVFRDGYGAAALRLKDLVQRGNSAVDPEREHEIGEILSYRREDVDAFIAHALWCQRRASGEYQDQDGGKRDQSHLPGQ